jgi:hypothetical protein
VCTSSSLQPVSQSVRASTPPTAPKRKAVPGLEVTAPRAFRLIGVKRERIPCCLLYSPDSVSQDEQVECDERWMEVHVRQVRASAPL